MEGFEGEVRQILMMMMAETCREFEKLPIIKYGDILREHFIFRCVVPLRGSEQETQGRTGERTCWIHIAYWEFPEMQQMKK